MLCRDCKHCKTKPVGYVASRSWCEALPKKDRGIHPHLNTVNPKCPLKINREEMMIGFEPTILVLQTSALTVWRHHHKYHVDKLLTQRSVQDSNLCIR